MVRPHNLNIQTRLRTKSNRDDLVCGDGVPLRSQILLKRDCLGLK